MQQLPDKHQYGRLPNRNIDVLAVGEVLIDLISDTMQSSLSEAGTFTMYPGGQAANLAQNIAHLGGSVAMVTRVGDDSLGTLLRHHLQTSGVDTTYVRTTPHEPTTVAIISRNTKTPDFTIYRGAEAHMVPDDMPTDLLPSIALVHTSAFALAREPSRSTIAQFLKQAYEASCLISFDPNYHPRLWESDPLTLLKTIYPYVFITKPSLDDCSRLFGEGLPPVEYISHFLALGARNVVLTMGGDAVLVACDGQIHALPVHPVPVVDVTGAGDAFWSGLLLAILDGYPVIDAARVGQAIAALKIQQVGPITQAIERTEIYLQLGLQFPVMQ